jgi:spermidine synthase
MTSRRYLPALFLLFVGSGCAALIYEIVWFQLLELVIGSTAVSLGILLATFMGGMCLGSLMLPRLVSARRNPLRVYATIEIGIGVSGMVVLLGMPFVAGVFGSAACLLPPTLLMGATLPALARQVRSTHNDVSWLGFLYGANIAGAVFGCLLSGFYLLRVYDVSTATYVARTVFSVSRPRTCAAVTRLCMWPSRCRACARWLAKRSGRARWACCWARRSTRFPSSWRSF